MRIGIRIYLYTGVRSGVLVIKEASDGRPLQHRIGIHGSPPHTQGANLASPLPQRNRLRYQQPKYHLLRQSECYRPRTQSGTPCTYKSISTSNTTSSGTALKMERHGWNTVQRMVADGLTKALGPERHRRLARLMGMGMWQKSEDYAITKDGEGSNVAKV